MNYKYCCVIDAEENYKEFVLVENDEIQGYVLQKGEQLVDAPFPGGFVRPKWNRNFWLETATENEVAEAKAARPDLYA